MTDHLYLQSFLRTNGMIAYCDDDDNNNNIHLYSAFLLVIHSALQSVLMVKYYTDLFVKKMNKIIIIIIIIINKIKLQLKSTLKKKCFDFWFESAQLTTCAYTDWHGIPYLRSSVWKSSVTIGFNWLYLVCTKSPLSAERRAVVGL